MFFKKLHAIALLPVLALFTSFSLLSASRVYAEESLSVPVFSASSYELDSTNETYTFKFSSPNALNSDSSHSIFISFKNRTDYYVGANLKNATISDVSITGSTGIGTLSDFVDFSRCNEANTWCSEGVVQVTGGTIDANAEITVEVTGVGNPSSEGVYYVDLYSNSGPLSSNSSTSLTRAFGEPLIKMKVTGPDGTTPVQEASINLYNANYMKNAWSYTDIGGLAYFFEQDVYLNTGTIDDTYTLRVDAPDDTTIYTDAMPITGIEITTGSALDYTQAPLGPIKLTQPLIVGYSNVPSGCSTCGASAGDPVAYADIEVRDENFNPENMKNFRTNDEGYFSIGSLLPGTSYVIEFRMPWDGEGEYYGLIVPETISDLEVLDNNSDGVADAVRYDSQTYSGESLPLNLGNHNFRLANKAISGKVQYPDGTPVSGVTIEAMAMMEPNMARTQSDSNGNFTIKVGGGQWMLMPMIDMHNNYDDDPTNDITTNWIYCGMPKNISFSKDQTPQSSTGNNFNLRRTQATITGRVLDPDGEPMSWNVDINIFSKEGCGTNAMVDGQGRFSVNVPSGTYEVSAYDFSGTNSSPTPQKVTVRTGTMSVGDLQMRAKNGHIKGRIWADKNGNDSYDEGEGLGNIRVEAFKANNKMDNMMAGPGGGPMMGGNDFSSTFSSDIEATKGLFDISVDNGTWFVNVLSDPGMMGGYSETAVNYIYTGAPSQVTITDSSQVSTGNHFRLAVADATIKGKIVNASTDEGIAGIWGFAFADSSTGSDMGMMGSGMGSPISNSSFTIKVPEGSYEIGVDFPPESSGFTPSGMVDVDISSGETKTVEIPVLPNDATVRVQFKDASGNLVTNLQHAEVFMHNGSGGHQWRMFSTQNLSNGYADVDVAAGTWAAGYFIDPRGNNYMNESAPNRKVTAVSSDTVPLDITLREVDSQITGTVYDPEGDPLSGVWVSVDSRKVSGFDSMGGPMLMSGEMTDEDGTYTLDLPAGKYHVAAFFPTSAQVNGETVSYLNPESQEVEISPTSSGSLDFTFEESDAVITGIVTLDGEDQGAFITAYSDKGSYSETVSFDGSYTLNVTSGDVWHVKAMFEDGNDFYRSGIQSVNMNGETSKTLDLILTKANFVVPDPVSTTFNCANAKKIILSNGTEVSIPANAIKPASISQCSADSTNPNFNGSTITVTVTPTAQMSMQDKSIPVGVGYEITAKDSNGSEISSSFNSNVTITIPYTDTELEESVGGGADETMLGNGYWDTSTSAWKSVSNQTLDTDNNTLSVSTNHFTLYGLLSAEDVLGASTDNSTEEEEDDAEVLTPTGQSIVVLFGVGVIWISGFVYLNKKKKTVKGS